MAKKPKKQIEVTISKFVAFQLLWALILGLVAVVTWYYSPPSPDKPDLTFTLESVGQLCVVNILLLTGLALYNIYLYLRRGASTHSPISCAVFIVINALFTIKVAMPYLVLVHSVVI